MVDFGAIKEILEGYYCASYFYGGNIPEKKLRNAINAYVPGNPKVYALYDATLFGSAKEGACFTQDAIHYKSGSTVRTIKYDEIISGTIGDGKINGSYCSVCTWCPGLVESIKRANDPVDVTMARKAIYNDRAFQKGIKLLDEQAKYVKNTSIDDLLEYRQLYIEAYWGIEEIEHASTCLDKFQTTYAQDGEALTFANDMREKIAQYTQQYESDLAALRQTINECVRLRQEEKYEEALEKINRQQLRPKFPLADKKEYYKTKLDIQLAAEMPDDAEATIQEALDQQAFKSEEAAYYLDNDVTELRRRLYQRHIEEQRKYFAGQLDIAHMYKTYGILESASDTVNAAISGAPSELENEKIEAFKFLVELLLAQYEYEQIYELRSFYRSIAKDEVLGYNLHDLVESHRTEHLEEYYTHLYEKAIHHMQTGKFESARKLIQEAKTVKATLDIRCAEINLSLLEFDYLESRALLDSLISDRNQFANSDEVDESIEHFEMQYRELISTISAMLKVYAITNNTEAAMQNNGYEGFVDADGLNLSSIAARFANHNLLDELASSGYDYAFTRTEGGFGIAFLAAMDLDYSSFSNFICRRVGALNATNNFVLNDNLGPVYAIQENIDRFCEEANVVESVAKEMAVKDLYTRCTSLFIGLLDDNCFEAVCAKLQEAKEKQTALVEQMKGELPLLLQKIDAESKEKCNQLRAATEGMKTLLLDVPESRESKANLAVSELENTVTAAVEFAKKNAEIMKNEREWQINTNLRYIETLQEKIDQWKSIDKESVAALFEIPSAAINCVKYEESTKKITLSLAHRTVEIDMDPIMAQALMEAPGSVSVEAKTSFEVTAANEFKVNHQYAYSMDNTTYIAEFVDSVSIDDGVLGVADRIFDLLLSDKDEKN